MNVKQTILRGGLRGRRVCVLLALAALSACTMIPLRTLWALRSFEFDQLDGAQLRTLVYLPEGVATQRDALKVQVRLERGTPAGEVLEETLALRPNPAALRGPLPAAPAPGGHWVALMLDGEEQQRLAWLRGRAQVWKAADGPEVKRRIGASVAPQLCRRAAGPVLAGEVKLSVWLRWKAGQDDLPMLDGATVKDIDAKAAAEPLPACT